MPAPWLFKPPHRRTQARAQTAVGVPGSLRSWLASACCLGAAAAGFALSLSLGRCEEGAASPSTLTPIMQTRGHIPVGCSRGSKTFTNVNPVR